MLGLPNLRQVVDCAEVRCRFGMERHEPRHHYKPAKTVMDCGGKVCRDAAFGPTHDARPFNHFQKIKNRKSKIPMSSLHNPTPLLTWQQ